MSQSDTRQDRRKERTRQRILDAARKVIGKMGYEAVSVLDITEEADVSKGTFYLHYKDKEDLASTLLMQGFKELRDYINEHTGKKTSALEIREAMRIVFRYAAENRNVFQIMVGHQASADLRLMAVNYYAEVVQEIITKNRQESDYQPKFASELFAQYIAGAGVQIGIWWVQNDYRISPDDLADFMSQMITTGLQGTVPGLMVGD